MLKVSTLVSCSNGFHIKVKCLPRPTCAFFHSTTIMLSFGFTYIEASPALLGFSIHLEFPYASNNLFLNASLGVCLMLLLVNMTKSSTTMMHVSGSDLPILQWRAPGTSAMLASPLEWLSAIQICLKPLLTHKLLFKTSLLNHCPQAL